MRQSKVSARTVLGHEIKERDLGDILYALPSFPGFGEVVKVKQSKKEVCRRR